METRIQNISRKNLFGEYVDNIARYLIKKGHSEEGLREKISKYVKSHVKSPMLTHRVKDSAGDMRVEKIPLWKHVQNISDKVIAPCGSIYVPSQELQAKTSQMVMDKLAERKIAKKKALEAKAVGDKVTAQKYNNIQTSIKININSLIGAKGSEFNLFYDLAGFIGVTSLARSLIAYSYTTAERLLSSNFGWFSEEDLINHIVICLKGMPDEKKINELLVRFKLKPITTEMLYAFFKEDLFNNGYHGKSDNVKDLVSTLKDVELAYLYYYANLKHLIQENNCLKDWITDFINTNPEWLEDQWIDIESIFKMDGDLMSICMIFMSEELGSVSPYDLPKINPELAKNFVRLYEVLHMKLSRIEELFDTFIHIKEGIPNIRNKNKMYRNTVIVSDTDSVIFTAKHWVDWYAGSSKVLDKNAYKMTSLIIYWLTKATTSILKVYSNIHGAFGEYDSLMAMKNEFLYPVMITYNIKKTYAGIVAIQEGKMLPKPDVDIKGQQLRSSKICPESTAFIKSFLVDDIIKKAVTDDISANHLIDKVVAFEKVIYDSLVNKKESTFLGMGSLNVKESYKNSSVTIYRYYEAWCSIFQKKYGEILLPGKVPQLPLLPINKKYTDWLDANHKEISRLLRDYMTKEGRFVPTMLLNPDAPVIPEELIPIIDLRSIIYTNLKPIYLTLTQLGISVGFEQKKLLFTDVYDKSLCKI